MSDMLGRFPPYEMLGTRPITLWTHLPGAADTLCHSLLPPNNQLKLPTGHACRRKPAGMQPKSNSGRDAGLGVGRAMTSCTNAKPRKCSALRDS